MAETSKGLDMKAGSIVGGANGSVEEMVMLPPVVGDIDVSLGTEGKRVNIVRTGYRRRHGCKDSHEVASGRLCRRSKSSKSILSNMCISIQTLALTFLSYKVDVFRVRRERTGRWILESVKYGGIFWKLHKSLRISRKVHK